MKKSDPPPKIENETDTNPEENAPEESVNIDEDLVEKEFLAHKAVWMLDL